MLGLPAATPPITPVVELIVPWLVLLLAQVPPDGVLFSVVVRPTQTTGVNVVGTVFTVISLVT